MTLVELMLAVCLLAVALVLVAAAIPCGLMAVSGSGLQTTATGLAQEPIDAAKRRRVREPAQPCGVRAAVRVRRLRAQVLVTGYTAPADCGGTPCSTSCPTDAGGAPTCRQVEVRVYVTNQLGETVTTLQTILAK
jgi:hypothetical protein